jgi:pantoate--beta-alanine ligase
MVKNKLKVNVIGCDIYRESNEAMSSRNDWQSKRDDASLIFKTLNLAKEKFKTKIATA